MSMAEATRRKTRPASRPASTSARTWIVAMPPRQRASRGSSRAVPEAAEEEDEPEVEIGAGGAVAIAPEGNVEIVAKPRRERDVPPPPELRHRSGDIRVVEVLREAEAEEPGQPDGHVRVARE